MKTRSVEILLLVGAPLLFPALARTETLSFPAAWQQINESSAAQEAARLQTESLTESRARASRHWLPRIYLDAKSYRTNDPGASFFGVLEQRALQPADFGTDALNHPESRLFARGALGIDLALYEGGLRSSQVALFEHSLAAQKSATSQVQLEQYSMVGHAYGSIAVLERQKSKLQALGAELSRLIKGYQLGSRSNPVGYSGLLGMKSLANRVQGLVSQYEAQRKAHSASLSEMGLKNQRWSPESLDANDFLNRYFAASLSPQDALPSYKVESANENVKAGAEAATMEKAKFLPRVGAFAETFTFSGSRDTANGYTMGLYLQWSLFDASAYGSLREARLKAMAAAKSSEAYEQQERAERAAIGESLESIRQNVALLNDSHQLLLEQSRMTETLFKNGSLNALQFVELLSRRTDLIAQQAEAELGLVKAGTTLVTKRKFNIETGLSNGVKNEN